MHQYRLIYDQPTHGARNMAVDEAIMSAVAHAESLPTLRFYAWEPPCLSLGYGQPWRDADLERIDMHGWHLVRRITGGRSILHADELTYSIAVPTEHPLAQGTIVESYRRISQALSAALVTLEMTPQSKKLEKGAKGSGPICFEVPSHYEITTVDRRKMIGSAQVRRKGVMLQHGSLPLYGDLARICDALHFEDTADRKAARLKVRSRSATLSEALGGRPVAWGQVADAIVGGFREVFGAEFVAGTISDREADHAEQLEREVYANDEHTRRL